MTEAQFYITMPSGRIKCTLCPRYCQLKSGQKGFCYIRQNFDGKLYSLAYGKPYAVNIDPIEKKPLFHFLPGTNILSIGTAGCNMACKFCQNWDLSKAELNHGRAIDLPPAQVIRMATQHKSPSIAYTYNEPTVFAEYAMDTAELGRQKNLKNVMVTNGYINGEAIKLVYKNMDGANVDLKAFTEKFYNNLTLSHLDPILNSLKILFRMGIWLEITNLIVPNQNDSTVEITKMCEWILTELSPFVPLHFTAFHPTYNLTTEPPTTEKVLLEARKIAMDIGIRYVYVGNVSNSEASSTYCHHCNSLLIERNWYSTTIVNLIQDTCAKCYEKIPGIFS